MIDLADLGSLLAAGALFCGAGFGLLAFALLYWTARDVAGRTHSWLLRIGALALVLIFNVLGLMVYLLLRPPLTLAERQDRDIIEELLAREVTSHSVSRGPAAIPSSTRPPVEGTSAAAAPRIQGPPPR